MLRALSFVIVLSSVAAADPAPIVGGTKVPSGKWPDVVAVIAADGTCTGTLIAPDVVLTAGHCAELEPYEVVTRTTDYATGGERVAVKWSRTYPDWWDRYDAGVVVLARALRITPRAIASACAANELLRESQPLRIVGFGVTTPSGDGENTALHEATVPVLDAYCEADPTCLATARPKGEFTAGGRGTDSCFGDSGGPAYVETASGPALIGVVSRGLSVAGQPCGNGGVYVRADKLVSWIQSVTHRRIERTPCDGPGDDPGTVDEAGCSTSPATSGGVVALIVLGCVRRRTRRRSH